MVEFLLHLFIKINRYSFTESDSSIFLSRILGDQLCWNCIAHKYNFFPLTLLHLEWPKL